MKRIFALLLALALFATLAVGCDEEAASPTQATQATEATAQPTLSADQQAILRERRDAVESYMRTMATYLWRAEETIDYFTSGQTILHIEEGRLYRGIPYTHASSNLSAFSGFAVAEENGIATIGGIHPDMMGNTSVRRLGNDCSGAVENSWAILGAEINPKITTYMCPNQGYLRVGDYYAPQDNNKGSSGLCAANGEEVMFRSYALLQKADAVVYAKSSGHTMLVVSNHVVQAEDGSIDGSESYITTLHQTRAYIKEETKAFDEALGEDVYQTYGIDDVYTYAELFEQGYLPITCQALTDPNWEIPTPTVTDSVAQPTADAMFEGEFLSNYFISFVDFTVTDRQGNVVQQARAFPDRNDLRSFPLSEFIANPVMIQGKVDLSILPAGTYDVSFVCQIVTGERFPLRQLEYTCQ